MYLGMEQVQNGCLYMKYRSSSVKNKAVECKKLTMCLSYSIANSTLYSCASSANLSLSWENKTNHENFSFVCSLSSFLPFFFCFVMHSSKCVWCVWICIHVHTCTKWLLCFCRSSLSGLGWRMIYELWAMDTKRSSNMQDVLILALLWLLFRYYRHGTNSQAIPGLLNMCVTACVKFASN